jgi:hypothetical protein
LIWQAEKNIVNRLHNMSRLCLDQTVVCQAATLIKAISSGTFLLSGTISFIVLQETSKADDKTELSGMTILKEID